jgi:hypothetical protein
MLSDDERPALVPLLGRAIGLTVRGPDGRPDRRRIRLRRTAEDDATVLLRARLQASVSERFLSAVGVTPADARGTWYGRRVRLSRLFWDLMSEPATATTPAEYTRRLVERLELLHRCYEQAMAELEFPPRAADGPAVPEVIESVSAGSSAAGDAGRRRPR